MILIVTRKASVGIWVFYYYKNVLTVETLNAQKGETTHDNQEQEQRDL